MKTMRGWLTGGWPVALAGLVAIGGCATTEAPPVAQDVYETDLLEVRLPDGFRPAADVTELLTENIGERGRQLLGKGGVVAGMYVKSDSGGAGSTVLSVIAFDLGDKVRALPREKQEELSRYMLARTLQRMAKRREQFEPGQPSEVLIDGVRAYRATYTGTSQGVEQRGSVYITISGQHLIHLATRQRVEASPEDLAAAGASLESLKFRR